MYAEKKRQSQKNKEIFKAEHLVRQVYVTDCDQRLAADKGGRQEQ